MLDLFNFIQKHITANTCPWSFLKLLILIISKSRFSLIYSCNRLDCCTYFCSCIFCNLIVTDTFCRWKFWLESKNYIWISTRWFSNKWFDLIVTNKISRGTFGHNKFIGYYIKWRILVYRFIRVYYFIRYWPMYNFLWCLVCIYWLIIKSMRGRVEFRWWWADGFYFFMLCTSWVMIVWWTHTSSKTVIILYLSRFRLPHKL